MRNPYGRPYRTGTGLHRFAAAAILPAIAGLAFSGDETPPAPEATAKAMYTSVFSVSSAESPNAVLLDGRGSDAIWTRAREIPPFALPPAFGAEPQQPAAARVLRYGEWLLFHIHAFERGGRVVARQACHGEALWLDDAFVVELAASPDAPRFWVAVNPYGALFCQRNGKATLEPVTASRVIARSWVEREGWSADLAVHLSEAAGAERTAGSLRIHARIARQRQARSGEPYEEISWPANLAEGGRPAMAELDLPAPGPRGARFDLTEPQRFEGRTLLAVAAVPEAFGAAEPRAGWGARLSPASGDAPLDREFQPTTVCAALHGGLLGLWIRCAERAPEEIEATGKELWREDNLEIFLGPEGFNYVQVAVNPRGAMLTHKGLAGGRRPPAWTPVRRPTVQAAIEKEAWTAFVTIPLEEVRAAVGAPAGLSPDVHPWRIQISRTRPARPKSGAAQQVSLLNVTSSETSHCPLRFGAMRLVAPDGPPAAAAEPEPLELPKPVLDAGERAERHAAFAVREWLRARVEARVKEHEDRFEAIKDAEGWRAYAEEARRNLLRGLFGPDGKPPERGRLNSATAFDRAGDGYRVQGLIFETRPGLHALADLYLPAEPRKPEEALRPALIAIPAHHTPRHPADLQALGASLARRGGVVLVLDDIGAGERLTHAPWDHKNAQHCTVDLQLALAGESLAGWIAFDTSRAVDYLIERGDVDPKRIGITGAVAGGGHISIVAAAIDERFDVSIPFNASYLGPEYGWHEPTRPLRGHVAGGFLAWTINAMVAPRRLLQATEFEWREANEKSNARFKKIFEWLGKPENLGSLHGGHETHATHFIALHRVPMYEHLNRWWGASFPLSAKEEATPKLSSSELDALNKPGGRRVWQAARAAGRWRAPHEIARELAEARLREARAARERLAPNERSRALGRDLAKVLGDTTPLAVEPAAAKVLGAWQGAKAEGFWLPAETGGGPGPGVALWLLTPPAEAAARRPAVLCVGREGKARFLQERAGEVAALLKSGIAVALLDVRGCGESSPGESRCPEGESAQLTATAWILNETPAGWQLKDTRTALAFLARRPGLDGARLALWGEGFASTNPGAETSLGFEEAPFRQAGPEPRTLAEPLGASLAVWAALHPVSLPDGKEAHVRAVLLRGGVASFLSALDHAYHYLPMDAIVPGLLRHGDFSDACNVLEGMGVAARLEAFVDGRNRPLEGKAAAGVLGERLAGSYFAAVSPNAAAWLAERLGGER